MLTKPKKFTIKRSEWLRGKNPGGSYLLKPSDSKKCCLGFYILACGGKKCDIKALRGPYSYSVRQKTNVPDLTTKTGDFHSYGPTSELMGFNDTEHISDKEREKEITRLFKTMDVDVEFID